MSVAVYGFGRKLAGACVPLALVFSAGVANGQQAQGSAVLAAAIEDSCQKCHNAEDWAGSLAFDTLDIGHVAQDAAIWENTITKLRGRLMPPAGSPQPSDETVDALVAYLETSLDAAAGSRGHVGHVPLQRLNRTELATSIRELIGVQIDPRQALPTEVEVEGFNNIAHALATSPAFTEQYLTTVRRAAKLAVGEPLPKMAKVTIPVEPAQAKDFPLGTSGGTPRRGISFSHVFPADGEYRFNVPEEDFLDAGLYPRGMQTQATLVVLVDGVEVARRDVGGPEFLEIADRDGPAGKNVILQKVSSSAHIEAGRHHVVMTYIERARSLSNDAAVGGGGPFGGGIRVSDVPILQTAIEIEGPFEPKGLSLSESRARIFVCQPANATEERPCAEKIARQLATRAYRRPVTDQDVAPLLKSFELGRSEPGGFDAGVTELVTAVLSSPDFLYRSIATAPSPHEPRLLSDLELATRLSFFLWNTGPDQQLLDLAVAKKLSDPATMQAQVTRMLKDPRAEALIDNFALAWLNLDELYQVEPQDRSFNAAMRTNFENEVRLFLASVLLENRSVTDILTADWTFLNESLAQHYGIKGVYGPQFRRVKLDNPNRFGILGKGAMLLRTSYGDRTSPVLRGAWILDRLVGTPPTPPPPGVETDLSIPEGGKVTTIRARLEQHRLNPSCNACHGLIDPPGFALENFDVTGRWRDMDVAARAPIDASTELTSGKKINGPVELRNHLVSRPDQFPMALTERLMMYALNREVEYFDMPTVRRIVRDAAKSNYAFNAIVTGIVNSDAFRRQGAEEKTDRVAFARIAKFHTTPPAAAQ